MVLQKGKDGGVMEAAKKTRRSKQDFASLAQKSAC